MSKRSKPKGKKIKPQIWVFCEGETEKAYVEHLRAKYRLPIEIISRVAGSDITERYINQCKKDKPGDPKDLDFLMYDADVPAVLKRLQSIPQATLLFSNPVIELWFLLHFKTKPLPALHRIVSGTSPTTSRAMKKAPFPVNWGRNWTKG